MRFLRVIIRIDVPSPFELNRSKHKTMRNIIIIGNGISGVTAAREIRKRSDDHITIISDEHPYFFSRTALMYVFMGHMKKEHLKPYADAFWEKNRIALLSDRVNGIDFENKMLRLDKNNPVSYDVLILATGSLPNKFGWPGQDLKSVSGLYHMGDLDRLEKWSCSIRHGVIVGGGLIGIELAEMLLSRGKTVTFLVRESGFWNIVLPPEESSMINRHIREHGIDLRLNTELKEIIDNGRGEASAVTTSKNETIDCQFVGLTAGVHPNVGWLKNTSLDIARGILVDQYLKTNQDQVYAIGDCAQLRTPRPGRRPIEAVWYTGKMMGRTAAQNICGTPIEYDPGIWFNSAKFLDIEYQTYGFIPPSPDDSTHTFYWEHPDGKKSLRINFDKETGEVRGFNLMGIRFRHKVCERWLKEQKPIDYVMHHLEEANFDPEFYARQEKDIRQAYAQQFHTTFA